MHTKVKYFNINYLLGNENECSKILAVLSWSVGISPSAGCHLQGYQVVVVVVKAYTAPNLLTTLIANQIKIMTVTNNINVDQ